MTVRNPHWVSTLRKQQENLMELAQSRGGLAANLAHQPRDVVEEIRDWCNFLLERQNESLP